MLTTTAKDGGETESGALHAAILHLRRGLRADGSYESVNEGEIAGHQWRTLESWAGPQGLILPDGVAPEKEGGREHDVFFDPENARWIKFTKPWEAGFIVHVIEGALVMSLATPLEYLERWRTHNSIFDDDVEFLGIKHDGKASRLVISQRHVPGEDATWEEIEHSFVDHAGMQRLPIENDLGGYESRAYFLGRVAVFDVRPRNCVFIAETNTIAAIDVIPRYLSQQDAAILKSMTGI
ncbi:MAG: hypothetical protein WCD79_10600 [Chthoniobacteraceae bacterium]